MGRVVLSARAGLVLGTASLVALTTGATAFVVLSSTANVVNPVTALVPVPPAPGLPTPGSGVVRLGEAPAADPVPGAQPDRGRDALRLPTSFPTSFQALPPSGLPLAPSVLGTRGPGLPATPDRTARPERPGPSRPATPVATGDPAAPAEPPVADPRRAPAASPTPAGGGGKANGNGNAKGNGQERAASARAQSAGEPSAKGRSGQARTAKKAHRVDKAG